MTSLGPRRDLPERLDDAGLDPRLVRRSVAQLSWVNRWLGGDGPLRRHLAERRRSGADLRVLDVGAGRGDVGLRLLRWAAGRGGRWKLVALDRHPYLPVLARERASGTAGFAVVRGDGLHLPFADRSFDVVMTTLTLHHFHGQRTVLLLSEMARVSRNRVLVNDLERHRLHHMAVRLLAGTVWRNDPVTRHDGPRSVLRGFTPGELRELADTAGLSSVTVRRHLPFRLVLDGRVTPPGPAAGTPMDRSPHVPRRP